ncbi:uncharacterized protein LOC111863094 isoform X2 [Cryptotermes secundus]|uniref:uncharacterized protein LOC111863094 isoform X2 n=1 Tax=Cryptotermes secundus TaxID=105785 RepID=UPI000CD7CDC9|nr:uncharacterized protein LOC111863094 isoform X2 [Cryptotermes secundus]
MLHEGTFNWNQEKLRLLELLVCSMGPALRARVAWSNNRTGNKPADCVDSQCKVLADKTNSNNLMALRRRRNMAIPQPNLSSQQKTCVYKLGNNAETPDLPPQERLALYNFEVDENEPLPKKKSKYRRKVRRRKKVDLSDTLYDKYTQAVTVKKHLKSGEKWAVLQKKQASSPVTCHEKITMENKGNILVADPNFTNVTHHDFDSQHNMAEESKENVSVAYAHNGSMTYLDSDSQMRTATENTDGTVADRAYTCQKISVIQNKPTTMMTGNKEIAGVAGSHLSICKSLAEGSEPSCSVSESAPSQVSSSCRQSLLFSPIERCPLRQNTFMTVRWSGRSQGTRGIQSVDDFTVDNYFGFDEESEDDLHLSLSPVKMAPESKPVSSVPFAVSSTPNLKPTFTRPEAMSMNLMQSRAQTAALVSLHSTTASEHSLASDVEPPDIHDPSPPALFEDKSDPVTHFMKQPRRSYERPMRSRRESHSEEESLREDETCNRKRSKRSKKATAEEKIMKKWAANVSAQFDEIENFELYVE